MAATPGSELKFAKDQQSNSSAAGAAAAAAVATRVAMAGVRAGGAAANATAAATATSTVTAGEAAAPAAKPRADEKGNVDMAAIRLQLILEIKNNTLKWYGREIPSEELNALVALIRENHPLLKVLNLEYCKLNSSQVTELAHALHQNTVLTCLNLSVNDCGDEGAVSLAGVLLENKTLRVLRLAGSKIKGMGGAAIGEALASNTALRTLDLSINDFSSEKGKVAFDCYDNRSQDKKSVFEVSQAFADALRTNNTLQMLYLGGCALGDTPGAEIGNALRNNRGLLKLDVQHNGFADEAGLAFGSSLLANSTLQSLNLSCNRLSRTTVSEVFVQVLKTNPTLIDLNLTANYFTGPIGHPLTELCNRKKDNAKAKESHAWAEVAIVLACFKASPGRNEDWLSNSIFPHVTEIRNLAGIKPCVTFKNEARIPEYARLLMEQNAAVAEPSIPFVSEYGPSGATLDKKGGDEKKKVGDKKVTSGNHSAVSSAASSKSSTGSDSFNMKKFLSSKYFVNSFRDFTARREAETAALNAQYFINLFDEDTARRGGIVTGEKELSPHSP